MSLTAWAIRDALAARGIGLSAPANEQDLRQLESELAAPLSEYTRQLYLAFNGFSAPDERSMIQLWSLPEIVSHRDDCAEIGGQLYFPAGDFLIYSDFVMFPCETETSPVIYQYEQAPIAADVPEFFEKIIAGAFDFR